MKNRYSTTWFELFLQPIEPVQTEREIAFITRQLPQPAYQTVLDLCCGFGRHARRLADNGYCVTGVDRSATALETAKSQSSASISYVERDMRELTELSGSFDAVVNLWQSFGYFDEATNTDILKQIYRKLNPHGRLILDLYHRDFFEQRQGVRQIQKGDLICTTKQSMIGNRLTVELDYGPDHEQDIFDWQLYTPDEIREALERIGFVCMLVCAEFDEKTLAAAEKPRMHIVCAKP